MDNFSKNKLSTNFNVIQCYDIHEVNLELTVRNSNQTRNPYAQNSHITSTFYIISGKKVFCRNPLVHFELQSVDFLEVSSVFVQLKLEWSAWCSGQ